MIRRTHTPIHCCFRCFTNVDRIDYCPIAVLSDFMACQGTLAHAISISLFPFCWDLGYVAVKELFRIERERATSVS